MNSWGILGENPSKEQIKEWQELPHGEFKKKVAGLKKIAKKNKLGKYRIVVTESVQKIKSAEFTIEGYGGDHAILLAKERPIEDLDWGRSKNSNPSMSYSAQRISDL